MNYEYNGNLTYDERIDKVSKDINNIYPFISMKNSRLIASLEPPINEVTDEVKFRRLFNILFIERDKNLFKVLFDEILLLNRNSNLINNGIYLLVNYYNTGVFPKYNDVFYFN